MLQWNDEYKMVAFRLNVDTNVITLVTVCRCCLLFIADT